MRKKKQKFVALNVSLPIEQKEQLLTLVELNGFATVSEYIRSLLRKESEVVREPPPSYSQDRISDEALINQMNSFAKEPLVLNDDSQQKVRTVLELFDRGKRLKEHELRRNFPNVSDREIQLRLANWVRNKPGAVYGDADGQPNFERLARIKAHGISG